MRMPTRRRDGEGSTGWEVIDRCTGSIRRGNGRGASEERDGSSGETRFGRGFGPQRHLRDGGLERESDRGVRALRPGNSGGAKAPDFRRACEVGEDRGDWRGACKTPTTIRSRSNKLYGKAKATPTGRRRGPAVKSVGKPDALIGHVRFDERGRETERLAMPQATAPFLNSTISYCSVGCMYLLRKQLKQNHFSRYRSGSKTARFSPVPV